MSNKSPLIRKTYWGKFKINRYIWTLCIMKIKMKNRNHMQCCYISWNIPILRSVINLELWKKCLQVHAFFFKVYANKKGKFKFFLLLSSTFLCHRIIKFLIQISGNNKKQKSIRDLQWATFIGGKLSGTLCRIVRLVLGRLPARKLICHTILKGYIFCLSSGFQSYVIRVRLYFVCVL